MSVDLTERKRAERALLVSEERLRLTQQAARIGTFEFDYQTGINAWTPELEAMHGLEPGAFPGTLSYWDKLIHQEDRVGVWSLVNQAFETGSATNGEWRVVWPDGDLHWLYGRFQVLKHESNRPLRLLGVCMDITPRKLAEERAHRHLSDLIRMDRINTAGQMASGLAHELNQPLTAIAIQAGLAATLSNSNEPADRAELSAALHEVVQESRRAGSIIRTLRGLFKNDSSSRGKVRINEIVEDIVQIVTVVARDAQVKIDLALGDVPVTMADRVQIGQLVLNGSFVSRHRSRNLNSSSLRCRIRGRGSRRRYDPRCSTVSSPRSPRESAWD
jgi:PAS domain S-box-containing protein